MICLHVANAALRQSLSHQLRRWGYSIPTDPANGLPACAPNCRGWLIVDRETLGADGWDSLKAWQQRCPHPRVIVLMKVSENFDDIPLKDLPDGHFLTRPIHPAILWATLTEDQEERSAGTAAIQLDSPSEPQRQLTILVAEDHPPNQLVMREMLEAMGYEVRLAADGREMLSVLEGTPVDLVFVDCHMPGMDGYEASARFRAIEASRAGGQHLPIIAITADTQPENQQRCLQMGMDDFLSKPVMREELRRVLDCWLGKQGPAATAQPMPAASAADDARGILDPRFLSELAGSINPAAFAEFIGKLEPSHDALLAGIDEALAGNDTGAAADLLHRLRGGASYVGAVELPALCKEIEQDLRAGKFAETRVRMPELRSAHDRLLRAVAEHPANR